jgi:hypothetical protein
MLPACRDMRRNQRKGATMTRKFRILGVAVFAVLALSAVIASAASASNFTASSYPTTATGTSAKGNDVFTTEAGSVECHGHFLVDDLTEPKETVTVTPTYTECRAFGFLSATVTMNGCDYKFWTSGAVDLECPTGKNIVVVASTCEADIPTQTGLTSVSYANNGNHIDVKANVTGITYNVTKDGFGCPFNGTGHKTGGTYTQSSAVTVKPIEATSIDIG